MENYKNKEKNKNIPPIHSKTGLKYWKNYININNYIQNNIIHRNIIIISWISCIPLIIIAASSIILGIKIQKMTMDVAAIACIHPLSGFLSSFGILMWWTSVSVWFFSAFIRKKVDKSAKIGFYLYSGIISFYMSFDDLFQFHESIAVTYLKIPQNVVYLLIFIMISCYILKYKRILKEPEGIILVISLIFLSSSVIVDGVLDSILLRIIKSWEYYIEDGLKWAGICFWVGFCITWCAKDFIPSAHTNKHYIQIDSNDN